MMSAQFELLEERLNELEARFAFQDELMGVLNPQVARQEKRIASLEDELNGMRRELSMLRTAVSHDVADEAPPPHF